jgi:hypothetical protein
MDAPEVGKAAETAARPTTFAADDDDAHHLPFHPTPRLCAAPTPLSPTGFSLATAAPAAVPAIRAFSATTHAAVHGAAVHNLAAPLVALAGAPLSSARRQQSHYSHAQQQPLRPATHYRQPRQLSWGTLAGHAGARATGAASCGWRAGGGADEDEPSVALGAPVESAGGVGDEGGGGAEASVGCAGSDGAPAGSVKRARVAFGAAESGARLGAGAIAEAGGAAAEEEEEEEEEEQEVEQRAPPPPPPRPRARPEPEQARERPEIMTRDEALLHALSYRPRRASLSPPSSSSPASEGGGGRAAAGSGVQAGRLMMRLLAPDE